jgi:cysteine desulfurase
MIDLDHNATTPILPEVLASMLPWLLPDGCGNPSSDHPRGRRARDAVEAARAHVAALVGAAPGEVVFTGSGTEADHLAVWGTCRGLPPRPIVTTSVEHPAIDAPLRALEREGHPVIRVPPGPDGVVPADALLDALDAAPRLLTVMYAHNETGAVQPVATVGPAARARGVLVHSDAAQAGARLPIDLARDGVDLLTLVGHKMGAPKGVAALVVRDGIALRPLLEGGGQERGRRAGTENVASIVAFGEACRLARARRDAEAEVVAARRDRLERALLAGIPGLRVSAAGAPRLPNTLHVCVPGVDGRTLLRRVPEVAASTGAACHADGHDAPAVLLAMGVPPSLARGAVRLSLGPSTTDAELDLAAALLITAATELRVAD